MSLEQESISKITQPVPLAKIAIVGMDAFFGECNGLDAFERSIYESRQHFIPLPPKRWYGIEEKEDLLKEYGLADGKAPLGAYITDFEIDPLAYKIPPNELEKLNPQQLLLLKVTDHSRRRQCRSYYCCRDRIFCSSIAAKMEFVLADQR
jgi:acyl transferase domain-containing protein